MSKPSTSASAAASDDPAKAREVFFDGACPVCRREIAVYQGAAEPAVQWRDVSAPDSDFVEELDREALLARFHVRRADGTIVSGFKAFLAVWRSIPRLAWAAQLLDRQPFLLLGEGVYRLFLRVRPLWRRAPRKAASEAR